MQGENKTSMVNNDGTQEYNVARHALFMADGVLFIFDRVLPFNNDEVKALPDDKGKRVFLAFGKNLIPINRKIMQELEKHRTLFLYPLLPEEYAPDRTPVGFEIEKEAFDNLKSLFIQGESNDN